MKNIHILPTSKPSRIRIGNNGNFVFGLMQNSITSKNDSYTNQNIYITSDEEIKEEDWLFANQGANKIVEIKEGNYPYGSINNKGHKIFNSKHWKTKIILTTDQDLIKDGVQPIDDEFLEWFVKNPSCESVDVEKFFGFAEDYLIIIPREYESECICDIKCRGFVNVKCKKPKQVTMSEAIKQVISKKLKQETLEEAAERFYPEIEQWTDRHIFNLGAKWQAERMYSDIELFTEELKDKIDSFEHSVNQNSYISDYIKEWFEQFKK
jgi:hypothetical protein